MGVCFYKKCIVCNEKKNIINIDTEEKLKSNIINQNDNESNSIEKQNKIDESKLNKNVKIKENENNQKNIINYNFHSTFKYWKSSFNGHIYSNYTIKNNMNNYLNKEDDYENYIYFTKFKEKNIN